jgi:hypothetical protein
MAQNEEERWDGGLLGKVWSKKVLMSNGVGAMLQLNGKGPAACDWPSACLPQSMTCKAPMKEGIDKTIKAPLPITLTLCFSVYGEQG